MSGIAFLHLYAELAYVFTVFLFSLYSCANIIAKGSYQRKKLSMVLRVQIVPGLVAKIYKMLRGIVANTGDFTG